jgi:hypothetical protein
MFMHCNVPVFVTLVMTARLCPREERIESVQRFWCLFDDRTSIVRFTNRAELGEWGQRPALVKRFGGTICLANADNVRYDAHDDQSGSDMEAARSGWEAAPSRWLMQEQN